MFEHMLYYSRPQGRGQYTGREVERMDELMANAGEIIERLARENERLRIEIERLRAELEQLKAAK